MRVKKKNLRELNVTTRIWLLEPTEKTENIRLSSTAVLGKRIYKMNAIIIMIRSNCIALENLGMK